MKNRLYFTSNNREAEEKALSAIVAEQKTVGYYALPEQDISSVVEYSKSIAENIKHIAVIGIGGSSLGAKAIYEFIKTVKRPKRTLHFFESTDPVNVANVLSEIDLKTTHFIVISKSGTTIETFSIYKYIYSLQNDPKYYTFITDSNSNLEKYANDFGASVLLLPENVGGRFSVLSIVGLAPLVLAGIDIQQLLDGAKSIKKSFFNAGYMQNILLKKATYYAEHHAQYHINCIFAYSESLQYFSEWYVQLWGESLGKLQRHSAFHVGMTPIGLIGPKDQHSFLQLIVGGSRDKTVTFIKVEDFQDDTCIPNISLKHLESLDGINTLSFSELITKQCDSVIEALLEEKIPLDSIVISQINEQTIGKLIYYYELLTSLVGELIDVNTYNQPGVEAGKNILKKKLQLTKESYEHKY